MTVRVTLAPAPGPVPLSLAVYRDRIVAGLGEHGIGVHPGGEGNLYWDPYCAGGLFPQALPPLEAAHPTVVTLHGVGPLALPPEDYYATPAAAATGTAGQLQQLAAWLSRRWRIDRLITPSRAAAAEAMHHLGFPAERIDVVPHGIDRGVYTPVGRRCEETIGLLCVAQWQPKKNIARLVDAWCRLPAAGRPPLTLVLPGYAGPPLPAGVRLIARALDAADLAAYYRSAAALVCPSLHETFALPVAEAMACGCAVAAADIPALRELYGDAYLRFDPRDPAGICTALRQLSEPRGRREELARAGPEQVSGYTWAASTAGHLASFARAREAWEPGGRHGHAVVVLGMHRGGTSAMAAVLQAGGIDFGTEQLPPHADNPGGYHEALPLLDVDEALLAAGAGRWDMPGLGLDPAALAGLAPYCPAARMALTRAVARTDLWGLKDPRMARLLPFWKPLLEAVAARVTVVVVVRHPEAVAASLARRDGMERPQALALWLDHMLAIERDTADLARVVVVYEDLVRGPQAALAALDLPGLDRERAAAAVHGGWQHHDDGAVAPAPGALDPAYETWRCLVAEAHNPGHRSAGLDWCHEAGVEFLRAQAAKPDVYARWQAHQAVWQRTVRATPVPAGAGEIHLLCITLAGREEAAQASAAGLVAQGDSHWRLTILAAGPAADEVVADPRIEWRIVGEPSLHAFSAGLPRNPKNWVGLLDAGDRLHPEAVGLCRRFLVEHPRATLLYSDEDTLGASGQRVNPHYKPDFNPELLRSMPYLGGVMLVRQDILRDLGWDDRYPGTEDYDLALRVWEAAGGDTLVHLPDILYHRDAQSRRSAVTIKEMIAAARAALGAHLGRTVAGATVQDGPFPASFRVRYPLPRTPSVSILIPTRNEVEQLQRCLETLLGTTDYPDFEVIVLDNDSSEPEARQYLDGLIAATRDLGGRLRVLPCPGPFNFSAMINRGAAAARGEYLLLLNNDTATLHPDWLREMMARALQPGVGAVGARLLFPGGRVQHAGVVLGIGDAAPADHPFLGLAADAPGYFGRARLAQDYTAVTAACLLVSRADYAAVDGMDEANLAVAYNDIDLCLKLRRRGRRVIYTPYATLLHEGSKSQHSQVEAISDAHRQVRFREEFGVMRSRWLPWITADPAYNPNLSLRGRGFAPEAALPATRYLARVAAPRILCHPADRQGCGEYRVLAPARALAAAGLAEAQASFELPLNTVEIERVQPRAVVLQRQLEDHQIETIRCYRRTGQAFLTYELDDLISNLPLSSAHQGTIPSDIMRRLRDAVGLCDRLVVATEPLAEAYGRWAPEVIVRPNYLPRGVWGAFDPPAPIVARRPRVGWAGGIGHGGDLALIAGVVEALAEEVDWVFFGMCPEPLRRYVKELHPAMPLETYPRALRALALNLALAPLAAVPFNAAKSNLRLLEYGACGYPVIASDVVAYRGALPVTRVGPRSRDWIRAIRERLAEPEALAAEGRELQRVVRERWLLEDHLEEVLNAWLAEPKVPVCGAVKVNAGEASAIESRQDADIVLK